VNITALFLLLAAPVFSQEKLATELQSVARVATVMIDGDVARRIQTPRSVASMLETGNRDPWAFADNYDVNHPAFIATKKTLMRLARLCPSACDVNLWMPVPTKPDRVQIVIRNVHEMSQFWTWGALSQDMPPEMRRVLTTGEPQSISRRPGMISVLAPIRDSLGDIAGLVEVVGQLTPDLQENVQ
jgi:hypothetical protein